MFGEKSCNVRSTVVHRVIIHELYDQLVGTSIAPILLNKVLLEPHWSEVFKYDIVFLVGPIVWIRWPIIRRAVKTPNTLVDSRVLQCLMNGFIITKIVVVQKIIDNGNRFVLF